MWISFSTLVGSFTLAVAQQDPRFVEHRLSDELAIKDGVDVGVNYAFSPDGARAAFSTEHLYVTAADGSSSAILLDTYPAASLLWSPDGSRLAYSRVVYQASGLFTVLADGSGASTQLSTNGIPLAFANGGNTLLYVAGSTIFGVPIDASSPAYALARWPDYALDASGSRVVFEDYPSLYSVRVDGSTAPIQISTPTARVIDFELTSSVAVYLADQKLWSVPVDGSAPAQQITPTMIWSREISAFSVTSDGSRVVYLSDLTNNQTFELYSIPSDGSSAPLRLTPLATGDVLDFELSPDGAKAVYAKQDGRIFSVPVDGSAPPLDLGRAILTLDAWQSLGFAPDSSRLLFVEGGLHVGPLDGSAPIERLDLPLHDHGAVRSFVVTPDSANVLFLADDVLDERSELFRLDLATEEQSRLSGPLLGQADVQEFRLDASGQRVLWRADSRQVGKIDLFSRPVGADTPPVLLNPLVAPYTVGSVGDFAARRGRVFFLADVTTPGEKELFVARDDGRAPARRLSPTGHGSVLSFQVDPECEWVAFLSEASAEGREELFRVQVEGPAAAGRIHAPLEEGQEVDSYTLSPDGNFVVYSVRLPDHEFELYTAPLAAGAPVLLQHSSGGRSRFAFAPDSSAIVHDGDQASVSVSPIDGSVPPRALALVYPESFQATTTHLVYRAQGRLFSVPLAGGVPVELNDPLPAGGAVVEQQLTPDGAWVVYRADALITARVLLLRVATDRSSPPLVLNGPLAAGSDVSSFRLTANGSHVIYKAQLNTYAVPVVGGPALDIGDASGFSIPPAGDFVIIDGFMVPLDGSPPTPLPPYDLVNFFGDGERLLMFQVSTSQLLSVRPDGSQKFLLTPPLTASGRNAKISGQGVVYREARGTPGIYELFSSQPRKAAKSP